jgi:DNA topoisomerase IB
LGCALALLDRGGLRDSYPEYSREDGGRGAATLTLSHLKEQPGRNAVQVEGRAHQGSGGGDRCLSAAEVNAALRQRFSETTPARDFRTFRASSIVAGALQEVDPADMKKRKDALKQSIKESARFPANTPTVAKGSYVHPLVQAAFADEQFDPSPLFTRPRRAGLNRGETALAPLLKREAGKQSTAHSGRKVCVAHITRGEPHAEVFFCWG